MAQGSWATEQPFSVQLLPAFLTSKRPLLNRLGFEPEQAPMSFAARIHSIVQRVVFLETQERAVCTCKQLQILLVKCTPGELPASKNPPILDSNAGTTLGKSSTLNPLDASPYTESTLLVSRACRSTQSSAPKHRCGWPSPRFSACVRVGYH